MIDIRGTPEGKKRERKTIVVGIKVTETQKRSYSEILAVVKGQLKQSLVGVKCYRRDGGFILRVNCHRNVLQ